MPIVCNLVDTCPVLCEKSCRLYDRYSGKCVLDFLESHENALGQLKAPVRMPEGFNQAETPEDGLMALIEKRKAFIDKI